MWLDRPQQMKMLVLQNLDRYGSLGADPILIESLAHKDHDASLSQVNRMLDGIQDRIQGYDNMIKERDRIGARALPTLMGMLDIIEKRSPPCLRSVGNSRACPIFSVKP